MDYFTLFQLPIDYQIDNSLLAPRYQELQRQFHPDRFATAPESQRLQVMQQAATINDAYQTLKNPLRRAEYLLSLKGIDVRDEQHTMHDTAFLMQQLELREELDEIEKSAEPDPALLAFSDRVVKMVKQRNQQLIEALQGEQWPEAADIVRKLRFLDKLQQQVVQLEDKLFDADDGR